MVSARRDPLTKEAHSKVMRRIRRQDTKPELALRKELTRRSLRSRVDYGRLPSRPDVVFVGRKLAIFVDGEFWHGRKLMPDRLKEMKPYWQQKIARNVARDARTNDQLPSRGWTVVRVTDRAVSSKVASYLEHAIGHRFRGHRPGGVFLYRP